MTFRPNMPLRWATLAVVLLNISFNYCYARFNGSKSIEQVTNNIPDLFTPPGYVFAIWSIIYTAFIIYSMVQLLPANHHEPLFDKLSRPLIAANVLCSLWIVIFTQQRLALSVIVITCTLAVAAYLFITAKREEQKKEELSGWLIIPFSLFAGWLSVATIGNISLLLVAKGVVVPNQNDVSTTRLLLILAGALGGYVGFAYREFIYPAVVVWATIGIAILRRADHPQITSVALYVAALCLFVILVNIVRYFRR